MDGAVLAFSAAVAVLTGLVFGCVPVYHLVRRDLNAVFRSTERTGTTEKRALWTRCALVVCQVSLAFVLLIGSGLLTLSFARLLAVDPGFQAQNVQTAEFSLPRSRYKEDAQLRNFVGGLLEQVRAIPGVAAAGATNALPFTDRNNASAMAIEGYNAASGELPPGAALEHHRRRLPARHEDPVARGALLPRERYGGIAKGRHRGRIPGAEILPAGQSDRRPHAPRHRGQRLLYTVIGVVGSVKSEDMADPAQRGGVYWDYKQMPQSTMHVVVKTAANDTQAVAAVRQALKKADPELPLFDVKRCRSA